MLPFHLFRPPRLTASTLGGENVEAFTFISGFFGFIEIFSFSCTVLFHLIRLWHLLLKEKGWL
jgi:hypothetical protein